MFTLYTFPQKVECKAYFENWKLEKWMVYVVGANTVERGRGREKERRRKAQLDNLYKYMGFLKSHLHPFQNANICF